MSDWTRRFALAALCAFGTFFFGLPVACSGLVLWNEHRYGDVQSGGPAAILGGAGVALVLAAVVFAAVWRKAGARE